MRFKIRVLIQSALLLVVEASCSPFTGSYSIGQPAMVDIAIGTSVLAAKAAGTDDAAEKTVRDIQVFLFDLGGEIDGYGHRNSTGTLAVKTHTGIHEVWAVTNSASLSEVSTKADLLAALTDLGDQRPSDLVHIGHVEANLSANGTVVVPVSFLEARAVIRKITNKLAPEALSSKEFRLTDVYLTNVAGERDLGLAAVPSRWYNRMGLHSDAEYLLHDVISSASQAVDFDASYTTEHRLYMLPNPVGEDSRVKDSWGPRRTRELVRATIGEEEYFYPITMPVGTMNTSYEIDELVIARMGVKDEETELPFTAISYNVGINGFSAEEGCIGFMPESMDIVFSDPGVNPFALVNNAAGLHADHTIIFFGDGTISPWDAIEKPLQQMPGQLIVFLGDAVSGYANLIKHAGVSGNALGIVFSTATVAYDTLERIFSTVTGQLEISFVFPDDVSSFEGYEDLVTLTAQYTGVVTLNGTVVPFESLGRTLVLDNE